MGEGISIHNIDFYIARRRGGALLPYTLYKEMLRKGADNEH